MSDLNISLKMLKPDYEWILPDIKVGKFSY